MKLAKSALNSNLVTDYYSNIIKLVSGNVAVKYHQLYTLGQTNVLYIDVHNKIYIILVDSSKMIKTNEIDFVIANLLGVDKNQVEIDTSVKSRMIDMDLNFKTQIKDIVVVSRDV